MSHYRKGRAFEYKVKKELSALGFLVFRVSRSKPLDLIAISPKGRVFLIECKLHGSPPKGEKMMWDDIASKYGVSYLVINSKNRREVYERMMEH